MRTLSRKISRVGIAALMTLVACGCKPSPEHVTAISASPPNVTAQDESAQPIPINFMLNPDITRPLGCPEKISVTTAEAFVAGKKIWGEGCGGMIWEESDCGMYESAYGYQKTPWLEMPESLSCAYAQTRTGTFLAILRLGANTYQRPNRQSDFLFWDQNYEPERQFNVALRVLAAGNSSDRKLLLTKIAQSLVGVNVDGFAQRKRFGLASSVKNCQTDQDTEVVALAIEVCELLEIGEQKRENGHSFHYPWPEPSDEPQSPSSSDLPLN